MTVFAYREALSLIPNTGEKNKQRNKASHKKVLGGNVYRDPSTIWAAAVFLLARLTEPFILKV